MQALYPYAQIIHLFCAIIFLGFVFFDVVIFARAKGDLGERFEAVKQAIVKRAIKIMPVCLLLLLLSGGIMMSTWVNRNIGYFDTPLQKIFMIKVALALIIFAGVALSLSCRALKKPSPKFMQLHFHKFVLVLGFFIVLFAKLMFLI
ncbi:copper resistance protein CopD [Campylobacter sp. 19-13652]|uniref:copper resistance protein CopD n=1 Tax=Campylobacter sp. 19-13652 TaxID=2840180 RepID=UPI001C74A5EA|nr:copper resistance protein CopD [Campylobacter sp. 19-13652]BCX80081.1 membrane protein [Campylobacter sp. 19-13652]